jgi:hypothetical protein
LHSSIPQEEEISTLAVDSEEEDKEEIWVEVEVKLFAITAHNQVNLPRDLHNPCTTCNYCNSFDHVIEECLVFLAKLHEIRGGNHQVQLISAEPHGEDPIVIVITRGGIVTG